MSAVSPTRRRLCAGILAAAMATGAVVALGATAANAAELPETFLSTASTTWSYSDDNSDPAAGAADRPRRRAIELMQVMVRPTTAR